MDEEIKMLALDEINLLKDLNVIGLIRAQQNEIAMWRHRFINILTNDTTELETFYNIPSSAFEKTLPIDVYFKYCRNMELNESNELNGE